jgi:hypothetical protein
MRHHLTFDSAPLAVYLRGPRACRPAFATDLASRDARHCQEEVR